MGKYTVSLSRVVAGQTMSVSCDIEFGSEAPTGERIRRADEAFDALSFLMDRYGAQVAPKQANHKPASGQGGAAAGPIVQAGGVVVKEKCVRLYKETKNGKTYVRATTPSMIKHGLSIWKEYLDNANLTLDMIPAEGMDGSAYVVTYQASSGGKRLLGFEVDF